MVRVDDLSIELVTSRAESYASDSRKPDVKPAPLIEDAKRRDFTVNTLMRNLHSGELFDPLKQGLIDLRDKILRTPLDPRATFADDPLRMLRAVRFRWQLGFKPGPGLFEAIFEERHRLAIISAERVQEELNRMLALPDANRCLQDLLDLGLLPLFAPELAALQGVEQGRHHHRDAWEHTLLVVRGVDRSNLNLRLAALFHDVAKPVTRTIEAEGRTRFFGHERIGAAMAEAVLRRLKYSNERIASVTLLVRNHMRLTDADAWSPAAARRLIRDLGPDLESLLQLVQADREAHRAGVPGPDLASVRNLIERVSSATPPAKLRSPLTGNDIQQILGIPEGPEVGRWLHWLTEAVLEGWLDPEDRQQAIQFLGQADASEHPERKR
jgi:poly(A) polymerase